MPAWAAVYLGSGTIDEFGMMAVREVLKNKRTCGIASLPPQI
jgi:hypothetical protein